MISYIEGKLAFRKEKFVVVLTAGGVGYKVFMLLEELDRVEQSKDVLRVFTHCHVREDALELYGFLNQTELELFELLITVSGVGSKVGLAILSIDKPEALAGAILRGDADFLTRVPGIGGKTAQKIILELKSKIGRLNLNMQDIESSSVNSDALDALVSLGWSIREANNILKNVSKDITKTEDIVREALKISRK